MDYISRLCLQKGRRLGERKEELFREQSYIIM